MFIAESRVCDRHRLSVKRITIRRRDGASRQFLHDLSAALTNLQESRVRNDRVGHGSPLNPFDVAKSLFNVRSTLPWVGLDVMVMRSARGTALVPAHATGTCRRGVAASPHDHRELAMAVRRKCASNDACSKDRSCALRSVAEVGLSARTREKTGHCSNAGGLSAV